MLRSMRLTSENHKMIQIKISNNQFVARAKVTRNHKIVDKQQTFKKRLDATARSEDLEARLKRDISN